MKIQLKTLSYGLINETQLEKHLESKNRKRSTIVIIVKNSVEASKLYFKRLKFEKTLKIVEKYGKARLDSLYISYADMCYDHIKKCKEKAI